MPKKIAKDASSKTNLAHNKNLLDIVSSPDIKVLVVDDEAGVRELVKGALSFAGYDIYEAFNGEEALYVVEDHSPDIVILDIMMPGIDGLAVCAKLRAKANPPSILFLSAKDSVSEKVEGLLSGGDDYMTKPFDVDELLARVHTLYRRRIALNPSTISHGKLILDDTARSVTSKGVTVRLTPTEYSILRYLVANPDRMVPRDELYSQIWRYEFDPKNGSVETYVSYLRRKLSKISGDIILTIRGEGYQIRKESL
jgi:two-component system OmpR family response regulator